MPVRLVHWLIVVLFAFSWWTAENDRLDWHMLSGYGILALVLFRIYWGFVGSATARFAGFLRGPRSFFGYAARLFKRPAAASIGHNPMGGWSVVLLLGLLLAQCTLGLFAIDVEGLNSGPLGHLVSFETGRKMAHRHGLVFDILLIFTAVHVVAVGFYVLYRRDNLVLPMVVGSKRVVAGTVAPPHRAVPLWWALPGLAVAGMVVAWIAFGRF